MSLRLSVDFPDREVTEFMRAIFERQLPFIASKAINDTAKDFQKAERDRMAEIFVLRRKAFAFRSVKIPRFSRRDDFPDIEVKIAIDAPGGRGYIFEKFEADTSKTPFRGRSIAVPTDDVPRTPSGIIRKGWRPHELLEGSRPGRGGHVTLGAHDTYLVRKASGRGTIFRRIPGRRGRTGPGVPLYQLVPIVRIEPELEFEKTAGRVVDDRWVRNFVAAFDRATANVR